MNVGRRAGFCDIHCHILPGIDDGPETLEESVQMCSQAVADGIRTLVATPHFNDLYQPDPESVRRAAHELRRAVAQQQLPLEIVLGADVSPGSNLEDLVAGKDYLTIGGKGKYILFEPPHQSMPGWVNDIIFDLRTLGLSVILTHPERNLEVLREPDIILPLVQSGVMLQVTADSVVGNFGREVKKCAAALLKMNAVHFIATDAHSAHFRSPHLWGAAHKASKYIGQQAFRLVCENPYAAVAGEMIKTPNPEPSASWL